jgi:hypothetical protein
MTAHIKLAILLAGILSCLVHLFGGLFLSDNDWFYAGPIALLAMIPVAARKPRTRATTTAVWLLAATFFASFVDEQMHLSGKADLLEIFEWAMLVIVMREFHRRALFVAASP